MPDQVEQLQRIEQPTKSRPRERTEAKDTDWSGLHDKVKSRDSAMIKDYDSEVDTLLVFAGLFSAILTALIVDVYQDLKVNSDDVTANTLQLILKEIQGNRATSATTTSDLSASPSPTVVVVVSLWFISLVLSLLSALFCIFMKQWLHVYSKWTDQDSFHQGLVLRGFYQTSLRTWHISDIFAALGVLLQVALVLFVIGLVCYLWTLTYIVSPIITFLVLVMIALSGITIVLPVFYEDCPYKFPLAYVVLQFRTRATHRDWAERDLPIAQRRFTNPSSQLDTAIGEAALLLDVFPEVLRSALEDPHSDPSLKPRGADTVREKIRQLSPASSRLLTVVLTGDTLLEELQNSPANCVPGGPANNGAHQTLNGAALYRLWKLVFSNMDSLPCAMFALLRHTPDVIEPKGEMQEDQYARLLVNLYRRCGPTCLSGELPLDIARVVDDWVAKVPDTIPRALTAHSSLRALYYATDYASRLSLQSVPDTGLSPVTSYLPLLASMKDRVLQAGQLVEELSQNAQYAPDRAALEALVTVSSSLHTHLTSRHADFLCTSRTGFKVAEGMSDEPRTVAFAANSDELYVGTELQLGLLNFPTEGRVPRSWIIWGSRDGPVVLLDRRTGGHQVLRELGQGMHSRALAISCDHKRILIGSELSTAVLFDADSRDVIMSFEGHTKRFIRAAFAPAPHKLLATSSADNTIKVWDVESGICQATYADLGQAVNGVAWSPDATLLATSSATTIRVFESSTAELSATLEGHVKLVTNVAFSPSGELLVSSSYDKTVRVWSIHQQYCIALLTGPGANVYAAEFSPNGAYLACAARDSVWIWEVNPDSNFAVAPVHVVPNDVVATDVVATDIIPVEPVPIHTRSDRFRQAAKRVAKLSIGIRNFMNM